MRRYGRVLSDSNIKIFLSTFKIVPCYDNTCPNIECIYYHAQFQKRRNPYNGHSFLYYPNMCTNQFCSNQACPFAHSTFEYQYHPLVYLNQYCYFNYGCNHTYCPRFHQDDIVEKGAFLSFYKFDLATFKSVRCPIKGKLATNSGDHQVKTCLYFHNFSDRRRMNIQYEHIMCAESKQCPYGDGCRFAHNKIEQLFHPSRYKSKYCDKFPLKLDSCEYKSYCSFAHSREELRVELIHLLPQNRDFFVHSYKTVWCPDTSEHDRSKCPYAHNIQDFRRDPRHYDYAPVNCLKWKTAENIKCIEDAGCENMMACRKCHGRKQYEYHPENFRWKNESKYQTEKMTENQETKNEFKTEEINLNQNTSNIIPHRKHNSDNSLIGAPFFKNQERQHPRARTYVEVQKVQRVQSKVEQKAEEKIEEKIQQKVQEKIEQTIQQQIQDKIQESSTSNQKSSKPKHSPRETLHLKLYREQGDNELFQVFIKPKQSHTLDNSQQQQKKLSKVIYSHQLMQLFQGTSILQKLSKNRIFEIEVLNLGRSQIFQLKCLSKKQKMILTQQLKSLQKQDIQYSNDITHHFKSVNKLNLLNLLRSKRITEKKLLQMHKYQIDNISFLNQEDKQSLLREIQDYLNNQQFKELNLMVISKVPEMDDTFFQ